MRRLAALVLAGLLLAQGATLAQERDRSRAERQETQPRDRDHRQSFGRERSDPRERHREQRFTPAEREKLRQDLLDANREMRGKRER
jgi:hypothetical protein